jgi:hypothetical protein
MKKLLVLVSLAILCFVVLPLAHPASPSRGGRPPKWEYKILPRADVEKLAPKGAKNPLLEGLNALGDEGWELVALDPAVNVVPGPDRKSTPASYYFKREK